MLNPSLDTLLLAAISNPDLRLLHAVCLDQGDGVDRTTTVVGLFIDPSDASAYAAYQESVSASDNKVWHVKALSDHSQAQWSVRTEQP